MSGSMVATDPDLDEEQVALVRLPPSPTIEPTTPSNLSTLTSISSLPFANDDTNTADPAERAVARPPNDRVSITIPTPKSTSDVPSPPTVDNSLQSPQVQDNCMFCTPETAPPGENLEWIQCNGCKRWSHTLCTGLSTTVDISTIDKFHCKRCEKTRGPTTFHPPPRKSERSHVNIDYTSLNLGDTTNILPDQHAYNAFFEGDSPRKFATDRFARMTGRELTKEWAEKTGCKEPVIIPRGQGDGLGMVMPVDLTVRKVAELVGQDVRLEVIDVPTQKEVPNWRLKQWADYYDTPADQRDRVRNVISLEVSSSALGAQVVRPQIVRDLDLIEKVWPRHLRPVSSTAANPNHADVVLPTASNSPSTITFPKVALYCLMSVARAYTDFHIDFGGSSVFYHILKGNKVFLFIEPNQANLRRYEQWCSDSNQSHRFLGEEVKECIRVDLQAGDTMIIPSGWIHAVYTPTDSLVLGGNFLTPLHIPSQLNIASIEARTRVPKKFRFPFFDMAMWYTAIYYVDTFIPRRKRGPVPKSGRKNTEGMSEYEIAGLKALAEWLWKKAKLRTQQVAKGAEYHRAKVEVPPGVDVVGTATRFAKWVYDAENEGEETAVSNKELPSWYRNEVLQLRHEPKKRKRDGDDGPTRKYNKKNVKRDEGVGEQAGQSKTSSPWEYFSESRPVPDFSAVSGYITPPSMSYSIWNDKLIYPSRMDLSTSQPFNIIKPYSNQKSQELPPLGISFLKLVKTTCCPYVRFPPAQLREEIKVEEEPLAGLNALSRAVEVVITTGGQTDPSIPSTPPPAAQPQEDPQVVANFETESISSSTLTILSSPEKTPPRLPTPASQSPPPILHDSVMREAALGLRSRSGSNVTPTENPASLKIRKRPGPKSNLRSSLDSMETDKTHSSPTGTPRKQRQEGDRTEARRLQALLTEQELREFRSKRRRGPGYQFSVQSLRDELGRLGKQF